MNLHAPLQALYRYGTDRVLESDRARVQVGNLMAAMASVVTLVFGAFQLAFDMPATAAVNLLCAFAYALNFAFVKRGWLTPARAFVCLVFFANVAAVVGQFGRESAFQNYYILGGPVALVLFDHRQQGWRWTVAGTSMLLYVAFELLPFAPLLEAPATAVFRLMTLSTAPMVVAILLVLQGVFLAEIHRRELALELAAQTDALTGLPNRRHGVERAQQMLMQARRHGRSLVLMMIDIDHFKQVNDTHGHAVGDAVLAAVAQALRARMRAEDLVARMGGEEFLVALTLDAPSQEIKVAEALRTRVADLQVASPNGTLRCTASIGVATLNRERSLDELLARADGALYRAKADGRNCVRSAAGLHLRIVASNEVPSGPPDRPVGPSIPPLASGGATPS